MSTPRCLLATAALAVCGLLAAGGSARAGVQATTKSDCSEDAIPGTGDLQPLAGAILLPTAGADFVIHQPFGHGGIVTCSRDTKVHPFNDPEGPAVGSAETTSGWSTKELAEAMSTFYLATGGLKVAPLCMRGMPCALPEELKRSTGFQLRPAARGGLSASGASMFVRYVPLADPGMRRVVLFDVQKARAEDWLEFSLQGEVFWKARLTDLQENTLYWVALPDLPEGPAVLVLGLYLDAAPASDSAVYFPTILDY